MTDTQEHGRTVQEISQLFDLAGRENEVIGHLAGGMDQLRAVQAAKHALAKLTPDEVRTALAYRRSRPGVADVAGGAVRGQQAGEPS